MAKGLFPELCSLATQDDQAIDVLADALLEIGELNDLMKREELHAAAQRHAFMTMAELICGEWQSTPWPAYHHTSSAFEALRELWPQTSVPNVAYNKVPMFSMIRKR